MKLVIAEKPSVAREIAHALGANESGNGFLTDGKNYTITWAFGHLLQIKEDKEKWTLDQLPLLPTYEYEPISSGKNQLKVISDLYKKCSEIVIATDAGREGELIARLILNHIDGNSWMDKKQVYRLFSSEALTAEVVKNLFSNLTPAEKYNYLYFNALARQWADWVQGINMTRFVTLKANALYTIGRVQTPVLKIIVDRTREKLTFKTEKFKILGYKGKKGNEEYCFESNKKIDDSTFNINDFKGLIIKVEDKKNEVKTLVKPTLHDITSLQIEANEKFGISPTKTLELTQKLYEEHKVVSYPRTDSNYLPESARGVLENCLNNLGYKELSPNVYSLGKEVFDDSKLTDHHALLCLKPFSADNDDLQKIYNLILLRMLSQFEQNAKKEFFTYSFNAANQQFIFKSSRFIERGFLKLYDRIKVKDEETEEECNISFEIGELLKGTFELIEKQTQAPSLYTEGNIIKKMKHLNLGTAATRDGILKKLADRQYIAKTGKTLSATEKGMQLIDKVASYDIATVEYTEYIEEEIAKVKNKKDLGIFLNTIIAYTKNFIEDNKDITFNRILSQKQKDTVKRMAEERGVKVDLKTLTSENVNDVINSIKDEDIRCSCGLSLKVQKFSYSCSCGMQIYKEIAGKKISGDQVKKLLEGKILEIKGFVSKEKKKFNGKIKIENHKVVFIK
ncbi:type IA DNA topoisomerase [Alistipes sp. ZOR0009]|uniref:type IA DNA topoisomerase n=1 Tax=Alistipes sp. ZOR0009 TaxID=1339253 RepID=UPI000648947A|nr:type IA DNA topoisomerase [Alistipes sp. ZOR0009]